MKRIQLDQPTIIELYTQDLMTTPEISIIMGCSIGPIQRVLREAGVLRKRGRRPVKIYARDKAVNWRRDIKLNKECVDCNILCTLENYVIFDWDHRPGTTKLFTIARAGTYSESVILEEIAKCDLRCANCHRLVTWKRKRGY